MAVADRRQLMGNLLPPWMGLLAGMLLAVLAPGSARAMPQGGYAHPEALIQPEELRALLEAKTPNLRIIDFRHKAKYYLGHLPGAIQVWRPEIEDASHSLPGMPASPAQMEKLLSRLGITTQDTLVIYSDQCDHARLWWVLAWYGFPLSQLKLLDGGLDAWKAKGYPTHLTSPPPTPTTYKFPPGAQIKSLAANLGEIKSALTDPRKVIVDVRPQRLFLGAESKEGARRPGHIPGAVWVFWQAARVATGPHKGCWRGAGEIEEIYADAGVTPDQDIYLYGHSGACAAYTLVSLYLAGYPLEKLHVYPGSWIEWSRSQEPAALGAAK